MRLSVIVAALAAGAGMAQAAVVPPRVLKVQIYDIITNATEEMPDHVQARPEVKYHTSAPSAGWRMRRPVACSGRMKTGNLCGPQHVLIPPIPANAYNATACRTAANLGAPRYRGAFSFLTVVLEGLGPLENAAVCLIFACGASFLLCAFFALVRAACDAVKWGDNTEDVNRCTNLNRDRDDDAGSKSGAGPAPDYVAVAVQENLKPMVASSLHGGGGDNSAHHAPLPSVAADETTPIFLPPVGARAPATEEPPRPNNVTEERRLHREVQLARHKAAERRQRDMARVVMAKRRAILESKVGVDIIWAGGGGAQPQLNTMELDGAVYTLLPGSPPPVVGESARVQVRQREYDDDHDRVIKRRSPDDEDEYTHITVVEEVTKN